ncbi:MAG: FAD:protein FMN transferase [Rikenellaceae bacterium]
MKKLYSSIFPIFAVALLFVGCASSSGSYLAIEGAMLGTTYHLKAQLPLSTRRQIVEQIDMLNAKMISEMSLFDPESQLSRINRGESDELTPWLEDNIRLADSISRLSDGVYDITVAPLVKAWGFGADRRTESPNVDSLLQFVGYEGISIVQGRIVKRDSRTQIDLNSIAKGYTVDRLASILESYGAQNYIIEVGGELRFRGVNPSGEGWRVGIETPVDGNMSDGQLLERRIQIDPNSPLRAMATSGNYRRFYLTEDGEKIVHTIDPKTGRSFSSELLSVSVLAPSCAEADAYATMLMAAGDQKAEELAQKIENCEVYFIYNNARAREEESEYREYISDEIRGMLLED